MRATIVIVLALLASVARATPYQALFEPGRRFTYIAADWATDSHGGLRLPAPTIVSCEVKEVRTVGRAQVSRIVCHGATYTEGSARALTGSSIAAPEGLYRPDFDPRTPAEVRRGMSKASLVMAAAPVPLVRREQGKEAVTLANDGSRWCKTIEYADSTQAASSALCLDEARGVVSVNVDVTVSEDGLWLSGSRWVALPAL